MPEQYRSLIVVLLLASIVFWFARKYVAGAGMSDTDFVRRRNVWYGVTLLGFLAPNFWIFAIAVTLFLRWAQKHEQNKVALFFFLILALPQVRVEVPGLLGIRYLFEIDYLRILILAVLLPLASELRKQNKNSTVSYAVPDGLLMIYILLTIFLRMRYDEPTGIMRYTLYWLVDVVIPYYTVSRSLKNATQFKELFTAFVIAALIASAIGVFEFFKQWLLYSSVSSLHGSKDGSGGYLARGDNLRAIASSGQAIILGYVIGVAIGLHTFVRSSINNNSAAFVVLSILAAGVIVPISRGPWVGVLALSLVAIFLSKNKYKIITRTVMFGIPASIVLLMSDLGARIVDYLPFVGTVDEGNVEYRKSLFNTSIDIILDNPIFGSTDYLINMEHLRTGLGIIDLVNNYLIVALNFGLVGLAIYLIFIVSIIISIYRAMVRVTDDENWLLGTSLLATIAGILVTIATVSPIFHVSILYWSTAAMGVAFARIRLYERLSANRPIPL
jgi:hypothetical protein